MGNLISFEKRKKRKEKFNQNKKKSKISTEKATTECPKVLDSLKEDSSIDIDYAEMKPDEKIEYWKSIEKEEEERFRCKYSDVLAIVPINVGARMQYFASAMLQLIPDIFHGNWDTEFDAWMDFSQFYITEFDPAYSDYIKANKEFEQPYQYKFKGMAAEKLEEELKGCLKKIIALYPEKNNEDKTAMIYQVSRLFELQDLLSDLFYKEVMKD